MTTSEKGAIFESEAARMYEMKGYSVVERNFRRKEGEIDLICRKDGCVVFAEVKGVPQTWEADDFARKVSALKIRRIRAVASEYLKQCGLFYSSIRFDVVFISKKGFVCIEDAF